MPDLKLILKNHVPDFPGKKVDISLQITDSPAPSVVARKLASVHWLICGSPAYLYDKAEPSSPSDLARLDWVDQYIRDFLELDGDAGVERVKIRTRLRRKSRCCWISSCARSTAAAEAWRPWRSVMPSVKRRSDHPRRFHVVSARPTSTFAGLV
ncbi:MULTISPECIES: hypothetical protein [Cupriavidus]|uniref:hypothetical protein n=1 Tax=Cupriavidus TaxID=106589 RepID=UPI0005A0348A|nr:MULTISPECIES: hypothetical protein [Cupriavidus]QYY28507.1 hypothetical protein K2O51_11575 [Cupriavidus pinatubonensis]